LAVDDFALDFRGGAPNHCVVMVMTGRLTSGASWMGMVRSATKPNSTTNNTAETTAMGRPMAAVMRFICGVAGIFDGRRGGYCAVDSVGDSLAGAAAAFATVTF